MNLDFVRVFRTDADIAADLRNVTVVDGLLYKNEQVVEVEGIGQVDLDDRNLMVVPVNLATAKQFRAGRKRGRKGIGQERTDAIEQRLQDGDKVADIADDNGVSKMVVYKIRKALGLGTSRETVSAETLQTAKQRLQDGDKVADISYDLRINANRLYKIRKGLTADEVDIEDEGDNTDA